MLQPVQNDATKNDQNFLRPSIPFIATQCQLYQPTQSKLMNLFRKKSLVIGQRGADIKRDDLQISCCNDSA